MAPNKYIRLAPGQLCERCGADNSYRQACTKWCFDCSKEVANERRRRRKRTEYIRQLEDRDKVRNISTRIRVSDYYVCTTCSGIVAKNFYFCSNCGQRLRYKEDTTNGED